MKNDPKIIARPLSLRSSGNGTATRGLSGRSLLALSVSAVVASGGAYAQGDEPLMLDKLKIEERAIDTNPYAQPRAPYKAKVSGDKRRTKPLAETPQTFTVVTQTQIQESGRSDLREIVQAQPGITVGTGENGNAFGDRYIIRGQEARSDVFVDGLRDPGMTIRESFAVEQIEVAKGPSSSFAGRGTIGGAVNAVTKQASTEYDFTKTQVGVGTDQYHRVTFDSNQKVNDNTAVRANLLHAYREVPDREPADRERLGLALSGAVDATDKLKFVADYYVLKAEDRPDLGTYIEPNGGDPVDDLFVYAQDEDFLKSRADTLTLRAAYAATDNVRIENSMRYGTTDNGYVATGARGTTRDASDPVAPGAATISLSTHQGWQDVEYFVDQLNLYLDTDIGSTKHAFVFGLEYSNMNVLNGVYDVVNTGASNCIVAGRGGAQPGYCALDADGNQVAGIDDLLGRDISKGDFDSDYGVDTISVSAMDTIDLTDDWTLFLGVRMDDFSYRNVVVGREATTDNRYNDTLWNGHIGVVYDINEDGNVYLSYGSGSEINGGESDLGGNCGYGGVCGDPEQVKDSKPEKLTNIELGTKWDLFNDELLFTAAIFQMTKDDIMENVGDDYAALGTLNTGKHRVRGVELSLVGNLTDELSTQAGIAVMDSEVLEAYDPEGQGAGEGDVLANFADDQLFWQLRYAMNDKFSFGGVVTYRSEMYVGQPDTAASRNADTGDYAFEVPSYTTLDLFATYEFSEQLFVRLNVANVTDEDYYLASYRSGAFTYIGDARNARLTLGYEF